MTTTLGSHLWLVDCVRNAGGTVVPAEWTRLRDRYYRLQGHGHPLTDKLAREMANPDSDADIAALYAGAVAEWWPNHVDSVMSVVQAHVYPALLRHYSAVSARNYRQLADAFNSAARDFTSCTEVVDVTASADVVLSSGDRKAAQAWQSAPGHAKRMDELLTPLSAAACLCGSPGDAADGSLDQAELLIPLVISDAASHHRRRLWNRWHALPDTHPELGPLTKQAYQAATANPTQPPKPGRAGRWPALIALGAKLAAHPRPSELKLIDPPQPYYIEFVRRQTGGGYENVRRDPCDGHDRPIKAGASTTTAGVAE
jgi:hypothetical protein